MTPRAVARVPAGLLVATLACTALASGTEEHRALMIAGQMMRSDGKLLRAKDLLAECQRQPCDAAADEECTSIRAFCSERMADLDREIPVVHFTTVDDRGSPVASAILRVGGLAVGSDGTLALDPGKYVLRAEALGAKTSVDFEVAKGARAQEVRAVIDLRRTVLDKPVPTPVWGLAATSGVALAVFGVLAFSAQRQVASFADCAPTCDLSKKAPFQTTALAADIALGVGVLAGLGAAIWYLVRPPVAHVERIGASATAPGGA